MVNKKVKLKFSKTSMIRLTVTAMDGKQITGEWDKKFLPCRTSTMKIIQIICENDTYFVIIDKDEINRLLTI